METVEMVGIRDIAKAYTVIDALCGIKHLRGFLNLVIDAPDHGKLVHTDRVLGQVFKSMCVDKLFDYVTFKNMSENQIADKFEVSNSLYAYTGYSEEMVVECHSIEYLTTIRNHIIENILKSSVKTTVDVTGWNDKSCTDKFKRVWSLVDRKCAYAATPKVMTALMSLGYSVIEDTGDAIYSSYIIDGVRFVSDPYASSDYLMPLPNIDVVLGTSIKASLTPPLEYGNDPHYTLEHQIRILPKILNKTFNIIGL